MRAIRPSGRPVPLAIDAAMRPIASVSDAWVLVVDNDIRWTVCGLGDGHGVRKIPTKIASLVQKSVTRVMWLFGGSYDDVGA